MGLITPAGESNVSTLNADSREGLVFATCNIAWLGKECRLSGMRHPSDKVYRLAHCWSGAIFVVTKQSNFTEST